jgi:MoxR-like ATPase
MPRKSEPGGSVAAMMRSEARTEAALAHLAAFFDELEARFVERRDPLAQIALALISKQHVLMTGPPGTAKSQLAAAVVSRILDETTGSPSVFARQITESTVQTELIGAVDFRTLVDSGRTVHFTDEGLLGSVHAFLDEVLDGRDMLLRSTLNLLEERELKQGNRITRGAIECALMTTNRYLTEVLEENRRTLLAFVDRIAFVSFVPRTFANPDHLRAVVRASVEARPPLTARLTIQDVDALQALASEVVVPGWLGAEVADLVTAYEQRTGELERADPAFVATRYVSARTAVRLAQLLRAIVVLDKARGRRDRALVAERSDLATLRLALMVAGPRPDELDALLAQEHEPRERRQLSIMKAEADVFADVLAEISLRPVPAAPLTSLDAVSASAPGEAPAEGSAPAETSTDVDDTLEAPTAVARHVSLAIEGHDLAAVRAMLERSRSLVDPADRGLARELRGRALELLGELVALGGITPGPLPRDVARAEEELAAHRDACELREALIAEGTEIGPSEAHAARWERGLDRVLSRVHSAIDAQAAELVAGSALDRAGGLEAALASLAPLVPAMRRMERILRTLSPDPARTRLGGATLGARLGPILEIAYRRVVPITSDAMRARVIEVLGHLATLRLERAIDPSTHLAWIADALVAGGAAPMPAHGEDASHLDRYRALRAPAARSDLAIVLAEIALLLSHDADPQVAPLAQAGDALARLPTVLRDELARRDLAAVERTLACLESWDAAEPTSAALAAVIDAEKALVRSALECELLAALFRDHAEAAGSLRVRAHALVEARSARALAEARAAADRRWAGEAEAEPSAAG